VTTERDTATTARRASHRPDADAGRNRIRTLTSRELFGRETEIGIEHEGSLYRLRITRQGKLILNK
jgi:hemin uptake protein HemP